MFHIQYCFQDFELDKLLYLFYVLNELQYQITIVFVYLKHCNTLLMWFEVWVMNVCFTQLNTFLHLKLNESMLHKPANLLAGSCLYFCNLKGSVLVSSSSFIFKSDSFHCIIEWKQFLQLCLVNSWKGHNLRPNLS